MRKATNSERIEGRVYQHNLVIKTVSNAQSANFGKEFISGNLEVAVDEEGVNVIPVHFTYVTETTASGSKSATYTSLKKIIDEGKNWIAVGKDDAQKVRIDTAIALNDFYNQNDELISTKVNEGGFVTLINTLGEDGERNKFTADMVITNVSRVEANPEKNIDKDYVVVRGAIFNFRNDLLPVDFTVRNELGMKYFEDLDVTPSEPVYTKVWGRINCENAKVEVKEESAFGEASVRTYERKSKDWTITGTAKVPYDFGDENILTAEELTKASQNRQVMLAETKKRSEEYRAQKAATTTTTVASTPVTAGPASVTASAPFTF